MDTFVAIDFETANQQRSSVCSVGLVFVENYKIVDRYYALIKPIPNYYNYWNIQVHGLTTMDTQEVSEFPVIWNEIADRIEGYPMVAHNSTFDESCLKAVLDAYDLPRHTNDFYCTYRKARKELPLLHNYKLTTVAHYFGYSLKNHHNALADAEACAHIAIELF